MKRHPFKGLKDEDDYVNYHYKRKKAIRFQYRTAKINIPPEMQKEISNPIEKSLDIALEKSIITDKIKELSNKHIINKENQEFIEDYIYMGKYFLFEIMKISDPSVKAICKEILQRSQQCIEILVQLIEKLMNLESIKDYLPIVTSKNAEIPTLKREGAGHAGGLSNFQRYALNAELSKI